MAPMAVCIRLAVTTALMVTLELTDVGDVIHANEREGQSTQTVTFSRDIAPILFSRCVVCHRPNAVAPFSLLTFNEVRPWARAIKQTTQTRTMPPWKPVPGEGGPFVGDRRLSESEIGLLARWVDDGAPEGDPSELPPPPELPTGWQLGEPDLIVGMPAPYTLGAAGNDVLRKFALPIPTSGVRFVRGVEFQPGNPRVVHHANMKIDPTSASRELDAQDPAPGYDGVTPFDARFPFGYFLGWTPGQVRPLAADGMAWRLNPGSDLLLELHLTPDEQPQEVQARIGFFFTDTPPIQMPFTIRLGKQNLDIPPGATAYPSTDRYVLPVDVEVRGIQPHAHYLAKKVTGQATLPDGTVTPLITITDWDFHWQDYYRYETPFVLPRGTELTMEFTYDNSVDNPRNPQVSPQRVTWGQQSSNEMGDLWIQVVPRVADELEMLTRDRRPLELAEDLVGFEMVLDADPDQRMVHDDAALLYLQFGQVAEAADHFEESVRLAPESAPAHYNLGTTLLQLGNLDAAGASFEHAIRLNPDYALAHNNLGALLRLQGRQADAVPHFRRALQIHPDDAQALYNLASALMMQGQLDEAIPLYRQALQVQPDAPEPLAELAGILATHPDSTQRAPAEAVALATRAATVTNHQHPGVLNVLAAAHAATGDLNQAVATAEAALALIPPEGEVLAAVIRERLASYRRAVSGQTPQ
ncbi:MAG: tetratricopeptide repeat protein [Acidobacteriota bacterium]|nr:tetratricopeptide repeat protein [Acidobacteriota bacterium]